MVNEEDNCFQQPLPTLGRSDKSSPWKNVSDILNGHPWERGKLSFTPIWMREWPDTETRVKARCIAIRQRHRRTSELAISEVRVTGTVGKLKDCANFQSLGLHRFSDFKRTEKLLIGTINNFNTQYHPHLIKISSLLEIYSLLLSDLSCMVLDYVSCILPRLYFSDSDIR